MSATMNAITFSVVDSMVRVIIVTPQHYPNFYRFYFQIYGNWIFDLVSVIFVPVWIIFWTSLTCRRQDDVVVITKEKEQ